MKGLARGGTTNDKRFSSGLAKAHRILGRGYSLRALPRAPGPGCGTRLSTRQRRAELRGGDPAHRGRRWYNQLLELDGWRDPFEGLEG